ncbi:MAG: hypothetical protein E7406_09115 [Ruminococcaceae bacterium]|nr:hypothetical protein [Oscillospiraceae bacterium]
MSLISVLICVVAVRWLIAIPGLNNAKEKTFPVKTEIIWEKVSPDSKYKAVMFSKDAGATTGVRYHLSIIPNGENITEKDNANVFENYGIYDIEWEDETTLLVKKYEEGTDYYRVEEYNGIKIKYLSPAETREHERNKVKKS